MAKNKLLPFLAIGAVVGVAASLLDKQTREQTVSAVKNSKDKVMYYAQNRDELTDFVTSKVEKIQALYTDNQDTIQSLISGVQDAKSLPETIVAMVTETKDAFTKK